MFCKYCGNQIKEGAKFCGSCGNPVSSPKGTTEARKAPSVANNHSTPPFTANQATPNSPPMGGGTPTNIPPMGDAPFGNTPYNPNYPSYPQGEIYSKKVGKKFTICHLISIIASIVMVFALFLPNDTSELQTMLYNFFGKQAPSIVDTMTALFKVATKSDILAEFLSTETIIIAFISCALFVLGTFFLFFASLLKMNKSAILDSIFAMLGSIGIVWVCGGGLNGTGYVLLLISGAVAIVSSIGAYMMNQNHR